MSVPANPEAMHGWFGYRHIPYLPGTPAHSIARDLVATKFPKKEFFEIVFMVEVVRRVLDPSLPIFECCSGHGLLGMLLACDPRVPSVTILDKRFPPNCSRVYDLMLRHFPELDGRIRFWEGQIEQFPDFERGNLVAAHACDTASDAVLNAAVGLEARFAVMPCCISRRTATAYGVEGVHGNEAEINRRRVNKVERQGYRVETTEIDRRITPWNVILCGWPRAEKETPNGGVRGSPLPALLPPRLMREAGASTEGIECRKQTSNG